MTVSKHVLFGVFDWGLGHATRSKPLIAALLARGHSVDILSTGRALLVLQQHFADQCRYHDVPSITSPYCDTERFGLHFALSTPRMLHSLKRARALSKAIIRGNDYDLIVSDCRYDVFGEKRQSFLINHQLRFAAPTGVETVLEAWLAYRMDKFRLIIVPDFPTKHNLSGRLSHKLSFIKKRRIDYIGHLSHIAAREMPKDIDFFISLTGPEPQRSMLEALVFEQAPHLEGRVVIAGGNPERSKPALPPTTTYEPYLDTAGMEEMLNRTRVFISRSGYTSMMELAELGIRKALLIPTPGQTEQEYLADYYEKRGFFRHVHQKHLDLPNDIHNIKGYDGFVPPWDAARSVAYFLDCVGA